MKIRVLGSSAGGGFPQWNCNCGNCSGVRNGTIAAEPRTQSSLAVSVDGVSWLLINASPDILAQLAANPELQPARHARDTGIAAVLLMDAQIDHVTGLLMLRENSARLPIYATDAVWQDLSTGFPVTQILSHYCGVHRHTIALDDAPLEIPALPGVRIEALPLSSKAPPYSPHRTAPERGDNIGLLLQNGFKHFIIIPRIIFQVGVLHEHNFSGHLRESAPQRRAFSLIFFLKEKSQIA